MLKKNDLLTITQGRVRLVPQLIVMIVLTVAAVGGTIGLMNSLAIHSTFRQTLMGHNLTQAELSAEYASKYISLVQVSANVFTHRYTVIEAVKDGRFESLQTELAQFIELQPALEGASFYDAAGVQRVSSQADASTIGQSFADREWYRQVAATHEPYLGLPLASRLTGRPVVPYAVPFLDEKGELTGIFIGAIGAAGFTNAIMALNQGTEETLTVVDLRGGSVILAHSESGKVLTAMPAGSEVLAYLKDGGKGTIETSRDDGETDYAAFTWVPNLPWGIILTVPSRTALLPVNRMLNSTIIATLACIIGAVVLGGLWMVRLTRPILKLRDAARELAAGNLNKRVGLTEKNEIGELGQAFDHMAQAMADKERAISQSNAELSVANKELEAFSYSVSHDLRAPLRAIDGFSQALLEDCRERLDDAGRDDLSRVRNAAQRMGCLIDDLLKLSKVTRQELVRQDVDLAVVAWEIVYELRRTEPGRKVEFVTGGPITVRGDARLLRILLENLLNNAWKFTGKHPSARIEFGFTESGGTKVYFIKDNGAGFDMAYSEKLFTPFQRLHNPGEFPGTGIGLATAQRIVRRHGGSIRAEGRVEQGAALFFTLGDGVC